MDKTLKIQRSGKWYFMSVCCKNPACKRDKPLRTTDFMQEIDIIKNFYKLKESAFQGCPNCPVCTKWKGQFLLFITDKFGMHYYLEGLVNPKLKPFKNQQPPN